MYGPKCGGMHFASGTRACFEDCQRKLYYKRLEFVREYDSMKNRVQRMWRCIKKDVCSIVQAYPVECVVMALGVIFMSIIFRYGDGLSITAWSVEIWDAIASGRLSDFTAVTTENLRGAPHGACGAIIQLLPWAIWNFPIWLTHPLNGSAYIFSSICVLWSKLFLIGCAFLGGLLCYRIINHVV